MSEVETASKPTSATQAPVDLSSVTLLVPTMNRAPFIKELLTYNRNNNLTSLILIGDSSLPAQQEILKQVVGQVRPILNVEYFYYPVTMNVYQILDELLKKVTTPYAAFLGDDDFFVPGALLEAVRFLDTHPDYSVAHGESLQIAANANTTPRWDSAGAYAQSSNEQSSADERLRAHMTYYTTTAFSVHRTAEIRENHRKVVAAGLDIRMSELVLSGLSLIQGKSKKINRLLMVRRGHGDQDSKKLAQRLDFWDWVFSQSWSHLFWTGCGLLADELVHKGYSSEDAKNIAYQALKSNIMSSRHKVKGNPLSFKQKVKRRLKDWGALRYAWLHLRSLVPDEKGEKLMPALLRPGSRYYNDLRPILDVIDPKRRKS